MRFAKLGVPGFPMPEKPSAETIPDEFAHVMIWYNDLRNRTLNGFAGEPISLETIEAYMRKLARVGVTMEPLDEELIARVDDIWRECMNQSRERNAPA